MLRVEVTELGEVTPRVIKIAETRVDQTGLRELAQHYGATQWFEKTQPLRPIDAEFLIEIAGRVCYRALGTGLNPNITRIREDIASYIANILQSKHGSVLEHASVTFAFLDISRVATHELVRHRVGVAISQESLRFMRPKDVKMWLPPELQPMADKVLGIVENIKEGYKGLEAQMKWDEMSFEEKKKMTSALRRILPDGMATNIIWTANHRTLRWVIEMRTSPSAEIEIRKIFGQVAEICLRDYPCLYGDFSRKELPDGTVQYIPANSKV